MSGAISLMSTPTLPVGSARVSLSRNDPMAEFAGGKIEAFVGPTELGAADNLEQVIVDFIGGAKASLDIAVQELDSSLIADAILDARGRGVDVRMFLEQDYLLSKKFPALKARRGESEADARERIQWTERRPSGSTRSSREILSALLRCAVDVKADYNPAIFHQKFAIRDNRGGARPTTAILSGSANFTTFDAHTNLNHAVVFHDRRIAEAYQVEFEQIRVGRFGRGAQGDPPSTYNLNGVPVRVLFAPDHTPELEIVKQMLKAAKRVDFAVFTFAGSSGIDDAMLMLAAAGRTVRGALDPTQGAGKWAAARWLRHPKIELFLPRREGGFRKLHHKLMVIDEAIVVAGSFNYTEPANEFNDENIFVMGSPYELERGEGGPVDHRACAALCRYFRKEIDRIVGQSDRYRPPPR
jgi:phosphatidylserine/phosphatidylglycerophosphate/cardiolipin synthase-like enzyme